MRAAGKAGGGVMKVSYWVLLLPAPAILGPFVAVAILKNSILPLTRLMVFGPMLALAILGESIRRDREKK
jgi:hypothetical protein